jgi:hypothetical protein
MELEPYWQMQNVLFWMSRTQMSSVQLSWSFLKRSWCSIQVTYRGAYPVLHRSLVLSSTYLLFPHVERVHRSRSDSCLETSPSALTYQFNDWCFLMFWLWVYYWPKSPCWIIALCLVLLQPLLSVVLTLDTVWNWNKNC